VGKLTLTVEPFADVVPPPEVCEALAEAFEAWRRRKKEARQAAGACDGEK